MINPFFSFSPIKMKFEPRSDIKPRVVSIEKQLESIRSVYPESSRAGSDSDDENTEGALPEFSFTE